MIVFVRVILFKDDDYYNVHVSEEGKTKMCSIEVPSLHLDLNCFLFGVT